MNLKVNCSVGRAAKRWVYQVYQDTMWRRLYSHIKQIFVWLIFGYFCVIYTVQGMWEAPMGIFWHNFIYYVSLCEASNSWVARTLLNSTYHMLNMLMKIDFAQFAQYCKYFFYFHKEGKVYASAAQNKEVKLIYIFQQFPWIQIYGWSSSRLSSVTRQETYIPSSVWLQIPSSFWRYSKLNSYTNWYRKSGISTVGNKLMIYSIIYVRY